MYEIDVTDVENTEWIYDLRKSKETEEDNNEEEDDNDSDKKP